MLQSVKDQKGTIKKYPLKFTRCTTSKRIENKGFFYS